MNRKEVNIMGVAIGTIKSVAGRKVGQGGVGKGEPSGGSYDILFEGGAIMRGVSSPDDFRLGAKVKVDRERMRILGKA